MARSWRGTRPSLRLSGWDPVKHATLTRDQLLSDRSPAMRALLEPLKLDADSPDRSVTARASHDGRDYEVSRGEMSGGGSVVRCVDITEKLRDEMALRQGQKMEATGQLTGGMAHDFNNILQVIQANLDLVKSAVPNDPAALARLNAAGAAADRGARLTQQLLAFARRQPLAPQPTNVARLVRDLADLLRHSLGERITIELDIADEPWNAKIDPGQLENAILNLAINARDAMPDGGTVTVEVSNATLDRRYAALHPDVTPGPYVLVAVDDTGTGMPPEVAAQAFDPFFTTKRDGKGTGLGLSMVYGFVRQSNGHIRIDSAIGQGTSVKLYLPRTMDPVRRPVDRQRRRAGGSERVLVVEDNDEVRRAVVDMLSGWGYRVVAAENPDVAAAILEKDAAFDLLFTDVVMPGSMSAIELAAMAQRLRPGIAVLLTSGYARDLIPAEDRPDYPLIAKPYRGEELMARLRGVLAARRPPPPPAQARPAEDRGRPSAAGRPRRVLLVEDEVVLRMSTTDMLEQLGCFVSGVGSGEQALELLTRRRFVRPAFDRPWPARHERRGAGERGARGAFPACRWSLPAATAGPAPRPPACRPRACSSFPSPIPRSICSRRSITRPAWRCLPELSFAGHATGSVWWRSYGNSAAQGEGDAMRIVDLSKPAQAARRATGKGPFDGELLDLYMAILIVIPLALFLKSLWS